MHKDNIAGLVLSEGSLCCLQLPVNFKNPIMSDKTTEGFRRYFDSLRSLRTSPPYDDLNQVRMQN